MLVLALCAGPADAGESAEKTLTHEEPLAAGAGLRLENLLGSIQVMPGEPGGTLRIEARVVAEADTREQAKALTDTITLTREERDGDLALRVSYPVEAHPAYRLPRSERDGLYSKWVAPLVHRDSVSAEYGGQLVEIGNAKGATALAVHVKIMLPLDRDTSLKQYVGTIRCNGLRGEINLEIVEGEAAAEQIYGNLRARTGGGELRVWKYRGESFDLQTGSGRIDITDINAERLRLTTGSGSIRGNEINAAAMVVKTASGNVELEELEPTLFEVSTGSGDVDLASLLTRTREGAIHTDSGDVTLRVGSMTPFDLRAAAGAEAVKTRGVSLKLVEEGEDGAHFRRRSGGPALSVNTGGKGKVLVREI
jgi:DUF4097 and DUF4098 domain-containing protein YvlB